MAQISGDNERDQRKVDREKKQLPESFFVQHISALTDPKPVEGAEFRGDEPPELTAEDEAILDKIWAEMAEHEGIDAVAETMSDEETLEFFGLERTGDD